MGRIWAVCRITIAEAIRMKLAIAFFLLVAAWLVVVLFEARGDSTLSGRLQMIVSYSLSLTSVLLCVMTLLLSTRSMTAQIASREIQTVTVKPIDRWQILVGKFLGIVLLNAVMLTVAGGAVYGVASYLRTNLEPINDKDASDIDTQLWTARRSAVPPLPDVSDKLQERLSELQRLEARGEDIGPYSPRMIEQALVQQARTVSPGQSHTFVMTGLQKPLDENVRLSLRFKYESGGTSSPATVTMPWGETLQLQAETIYGQWIIGPYRSDRSRVFTWQGAKKTRTAHAIPLPEFEPDKCPIEPDGTLQVTFVNLDPRGISAQFPIEDGIEVLYDAGSFEANFVRTVLILLMRIMFLAAFGLALSTFLSFPVAAMAGLFVYFLSFSRNFLIESIGLTSSLRKLSTWEQLLFSLSQDFSLDKLIGSIAIMLAPDIEAGRPVDALISGRIVDWAAVGSNCISLVLISGGIAMVLGIVIFKRRELGQVVTT